MPGATRKKPVLVIAEFPYLVKANTAMPSILQIFWDELGKGKKFAGRSCRG
ncbi:hypothetical protein G7K71_14590 [Desulfofundulus sp. TPOSR]|uniref:hypothetical protein n=1 Tax=Desulfofundulus sp. TPOSR TaxID=2714340 RepID=UPI00140A3AF5|nr:hypothetical protein [Desulfofundulus sp. TPOSR]NHM28181.1 hypothetical protein [Desulfofundulus sp. TPOSR]